LGQDSSPRLFYLVLQPKNPTSTDGSTIKRLIIFPGATRVPLVESSNPEEMSQPEFSRSESEGNTIKVIGSLKKAKI